MKFIQRSTGTVLETDDKAAIEIMTASDAYVVEQEQPEQEQPEQEQPEQEQPEQEQPEQEQPTKKTSRGAKK